MKKINIWNIKEGDEVQKVVATYCWIHGEEITEQTQKWIEDLKNNQKDFDELKSYVLQCLEDRIKANQSFIDLLKA